MPYAKKIGPVHGPSERQQIEAVFQYPGLSDMKDVLSPYDSYGRRAEYPLLLSLGVAITARIYGSQNQALDRLRKEGLWDVVTDLYHRKFPDADVPRLPPSPEQQDRFVKHVTNTPGLLPLIAEQFTVSAVGQAIYLGNFPEGAEPDFANPDPRNIAQGDGTFYERFSKVRLEVDSTTGEITYSGSRSRYNRPRIQQVTTKGSLDDKSDAVGINHVTLLTWTDAGWVVLANAQALGGEVHAAREVIETVYSYLGSRLQTVVWDRALSGHHLESLMAQHRILVVNKNVARGKDSANIRASGGPVLYTPRTLSDAEARARYEEGQPLPIGTSVYRTPDNYEVVHSKFRRIGRHGQIDCPHDLWVDDGALVDASYDGIHFWKQTRASAISATPEFDLASGTWTLRTQWRLECSKATGGAHLFTTTWRPNATKKDRRVNDIQDAFNELRPISRADGVRFRKIHGLRNTTESYNAWAKSRFGNGTKKGRAMRLTAAGQFLDHICVGMLANAITAWRASRPR